jgi:hypothetical protein
MVQSLSERLQLKPTRSSPEHAALLGPLPAGVVDLPGEEPVDVLLALLRLRGIPKNRILWGVL